MSAAAPKTPTLTEAALRQRLSAASSHCTARGAQLTPQRAEVLELLLRRSGRAKAYDLQEDMQARHGRVAPTTVYRALEFLQEQHLVHKADATNTFVVCDHAAHDHPALLLICTDCGRIDEMHDDRALGALLSHASQQGMLPRAVEVKCVCTDCHASAAV